MAAKQVVLTGATSGIGKRLLQRLLASGESVHVVVPTRSMGVAKQLFGAAANVVPVECDLLDLTSVQKAAQDITQQCQKGCIDVLILNAGIMNEKLRHTPAGFEETFLANHLSQFQLLRELMPLLLKAEAPRVVLVGSELHKSVPTPASAGAAAAKKKVVTWEPEQALFQLSPACQGKVQGLPSTPPTPLSGGMAYNVSKLYNIWTARVLAERAGSKLWTACVSPGFVPSTNLSRSWAGWRQWAFRNVMGLLPFAVSEDEGVERVYRVAFGPLQSPVAAPAPAPQGTSSTPTTTASDVTASGGYWARRQPNPGSELSQDLARAQRMWDASMQVLGITDFLGPLGRVSA